MDSLPDMRQKNTNEGISGHCAGEIPAVLFHMQEGNPNQCGTTENGCKRRARRLKHRACFPGTRGCRLCLCIGRYAPSQGSAFFVRSVLRIVSTTGINAAASCSVQLSIWTRSALLVELSCFNSGLKTSRASILSIRIRGVKRPHLRIPPVVFDVHDRPRIGVDLTGDLLLRKPQIISGHLHGIAQGSGVILHCISPQVNSTIPCVSFEFIAVPLIERIYVL